MNSSKTESDPHLFVIAWSTNGLEFLLDQTIQQQYNLINILKEESTTHSNPIAVLISTATARPEKDYQIYSFESTLSAGEICYAFATDNQTLIQDIKENGTLLYNLKLKESLC